MSFFPINLNIPATGNDPTADQPNMLINNNSFAGIWDIDHFGFNQSTGGYHDIIHLPPNSTPAAISGIGQIFTQTVGPDVQLFYESGNGIVSQLTSPLTPLASGNGYSYLPGGVVIQWGSVTLSGTGTYVVTFPYSFLSAVYSITGIGQTNSSPTNNIFVKQSTVALSGFSAVNFSASITVFNWIAIGK